MKIKDLHAKLKPLVTHDERVIDGGRFWLVLMIGDGTYLAAWIDEEGNLQTASRRSSQRAVALATESWGQ